jgi:hypothetical protein
MVSESFVCLENLFETSLTCNKMMAYSKSAPKTKKMQQMTQDCMAFSPSALGELVVVVLKMLTWRQKKARRVSMRGLRNHEYTSSCLR